ncbi:MAG: ABC transporter permease [SAR324 cluster bacterium]|nr:ABC transporter permease [SAR324 cluster bacterium]
MSIYAVQFLIGLSDASVLFLTASGLSIIFGVSRIVNFSHGSFYMLGAYIGYSLIGDSDNPLIFWGGLFLAAVVTGLVGVLVEIVLLRRLYHVPELFQLIATFGVILVIQDLTFMIWGAEDLLGPRAPGLTGSIELLGALVPSYDIALIVLSPLVLVGIWLLFYKTRWGALVRAATEDREMVAALGVNQNLLFTGVFFLGCFLAGLGGAAQLPKGGANLLMDFGIIAEVFVVVVVGGMGSIWGAYIAAIIISELNAFGILFLPESSLVMMFLAMAVILIARPWGLFGKSESMEHKPPSEREDLTISGRKLPWNWGWLLLIAVLLVIPWFQIDFVMTLVIEMVLLSFFAATLHFIMGPGGMVSFGHALFFGGGSYAVALFVNYLQLPMSVLLIAGPAVTMVFALLVGWFCVRLSGVYFAMLTLAFAQLAWSVVFQWDSVTGGDDGIIGVWPTGPAEDKIVFYYLVITLTSLSLYVIRRVISSPFGFALRACRDSSLRSRAIGIDVRKIQWIAFTISGFMAGLAGSLYVYSKGSIFPTEMAIPRSFDALIMLLLGGVQSPVGPIIGGSVYTFLIDYITRFDYWRLLLGIMIMLLIVLFPRGISGIFSSGIIQRIKLLGQSE